jgi:sugar O-acyltransferase (sialic acid O-acetyltransferase NeuD family)
LAACHNPQQVPQFFCHSFCRSRKKPGNELLNYSAEVEAFVSKVVIFGTGSFAQLVHFYLTHDSEHEVVAFTAHETHLTAKEFMGLPVVSFDNIQQQYPSDAFKLYVAIGYKNLNRVRAQVYVEAKTKGYELISYVSSKCTHWGDTQIGDNCFIFENNTLQPFVTIGKNTVLWSGNHIGHHSTIGDHCFITSHVVISGHVRIGSYSFLGVNATIRDSISVGEACIIGAGSLIMKSTKDREVYFVKGTQSHPVKSDEILL